jgi:hypothetical protein
MNRGGQKPKPKPKARPKKGRLKTSIDYSATCGMNRVEYADWEKEHGLAKSPQTELIGKEPELKQKEIVRYNPVKWRKRLLISVATEGWIRFEWAHSRYGQVIPVNWECQGFDINYTVCGYSIHDAYNLIVKKAIEMDVEWLIIIEDDVLVPPNLFIRFSEYMDAGDIPVVSGLTYTKSEPAIPLLFRGRGNGAFHGWKLGQRVWVDGLPMGCLLIHTSILKWFWEHEMAYKGSDGTDLKMVFETPRVLFYDPEKGGIERQEGTQDLHFFDRVMSNNVLKETGWGKMARKKYPFLCDTSILCKHIDRGSGKQYP